MLIGKRGIAMVGDSYGQAFDDFAAASLGLTLVTHAQDAFDRLVSGDGDYFLYSLYAGNDFLRKAGTATRFRSLPRFVSEEPFYITISKRSPYVSLLPQINAGIAKYKSNATIPALIEQFKQR